MGKNEIVPASEYALLKVDEDKMKRVLARNLGNSGATAQDLERVKMPSGESKFFEIGGLEGEETAKEIVGVILHSQEARAYWAKSLDDGGGSDRPDCSSADALVGRGDPGGLCHSCKLSQFGSALKGNGQACKHIRQIFIVESGDIMPKIVALPPTSLAPMRKYGMRLANKLLEYPEVVTRFALEQKQNDKGVKYCVVKPSVAETLKPDVAKKMMALSESMKVVFEQNQATAEDFGGGQSESGQQSDSARRQSKGVAPENEPDLEPETKPDSDERIPF